MQRKFKALRCHLAMPTWGQCFLFLFPPQGTSQFRDIAEDYVFLVLSSFFFDDAVKGLPRCDEKLVSQLYLLCLIRIICSLACDRHLSILGMVIQLCLIRVICSFIRTTMLSLSPEAYLIIDNPNDFRCWASRCMLIVCFLKSCQCMPSTPFLRE